MTDRTAVNLAQLFPELGQRTYIMGVLNVTPDSFSDGGLFASAHAAVDAAKRMNDEGVDIIDIGGESTRPGAPEVSVSTELDRVMPVIEALAPAGWTLSIDTTKAEVARRAVEAGATLVNDVSAMTFDPAMAATVAELGIPIVLSHTRGRPTVMQKGDLTYEGGVVEAVRSELSKAIERGVAAGIRGDRVILDPGIGFGKTVDDNLALLKSLDVLRGVGCPVLVGTSRKSFLGTLTGRSVDQRLAATLSSVALAVAYGADMVRVHDVAATRDAIRVADALVRGTRT